ncbi:hypothetical protein E5D57_007867 [Metarhizium anisopliae]|nr:hypothetical protein E5D57_007867 [Metarhizium anisopliae]
MDSDLVEEFSPQETESHLVVMFKSTSPVRVNSRGLELASEAIEPVQAVLDRHHASLKLLFGHDENRLRREQEEVLRAGVLAGEPGVPSGAEAGGEPSGQVTGGPMPDMASFYYVDGPVENLERLAEDLNKEDLVEAAYIAPAASVPLTVQPLVAPQTMDVPAMTPSFTSRQVYLGPAPAGIDASYGNSLPGGKGEELRVIDCEWGWRFTHEDLKMLQGGVVSGTNSTDVRFVNHGTAVSGVISGDVNNFGVLGIAPEAIFCGSSFVGQPVATAIKAAADKLRPGDVILLEVHRPGPKAPTPAQGQKGFIAVEWWPAEFMAIRYAVSKGIVVVEAAGNGSENLDAAVYNTPSTGFPSWWRNPFNPQNPSSGAVIVGAGCPPPGVHGRNHGPDRSRLGFSNYGSRVDCQGWGREVTSTGYGDLQGGVSQDLWYTDTFSGTSSASPIVTGSVLCVQGIRKNKGRRLLTSPQFQNLLRQWGSPQEPSPDAPVTQRIGKRPNLKTLIPAALSIP